MFTEYTDNLNDGSTGILVQRWLRHDADVLHGIIVTGFCSNIIL